MHAVNDLGILIDVWYLNKLLTYFTNLPFCKFIIFAIWLFQPELDVQLSVNDPLLSESQLENCNLASVSIESLYSPPEGWSLTGPQYMYTAAMPLPFMGEVSFTHFDYPEYAQPVQLVNNYASSGMHVCVHLIATVSAATASIAVAHKDLWKWYLKNL